jgi:hypothetical protein
VTTFLGRKIGGKLQGDLITDSSISLISEAQRGGSRGYEEARFILRYMRKSSSAMTMTFLLNT